MNAYTDEYVPTPLYFDEGGRVYSSRAMESIYEGREDYEYVTIARSLIKQIRSTGGDTAVTKQASQTVDDAVSTVVAALLAPPPGERFHRVEHPQRPQVADRQRLVLFDPIGQLEGARELSHHTPPASSSGK